MPALTVPCPPIAAPRRKAAAPNWAAIRAAVFWSAVAVILVGPAALSALVMVHG